MNIKGETQSTIIESHNITLKGGFTLLQLFKSIGRIRNLVFGKSAKNMLEFLVILSIVSAEFAIFKTWKSLLAHLFD